ncbi:MAG: hypothetical protein CMJ94_02025 [Planctomycetes bacterium]|nr:hypothetical protein [Planctomycetota bacterium]
MLLSSLILLAAAAPAQLPEDPGPYAAGWQVVSFADQNYGAGTVRARVHYPAQLAGRDTAVDLSGAPYQPVALMHGWLGSADGLDDLGNHLASHGYLVINLDTEKGLFPDVPAYAVDTRAALQWLEDESGDPASWLSGMAQSGVNWAAIGHSMGGGTLSHLIGIEPRVRAILGMQAADAIAPGPANMSQYTGAALWIAGSVDNIVPTGQVRRWYDRAGVTERRMFVEVEGMGHSGCLDNPPNNQPMPGDVQKRVHLRMLTLFLDAELRGEDAEYEYLVADVGGAAPWSFDQDCERPLLWGGASLTSQAGLFGVHGAAGSQTIFAWSTQLGSTSTPFGDAALDLNFGALTPPLSLGAAGWGKDYYAFPPSWSGTTVYFQAAVFQNAIDGALTAPLSLPIP